MASANEILSAPTFVDAHDRDTYDTADIIQTAAPSEPVYDYLPDAPRCNCCPYGFHVDVGFVQYAEDAKRGKYLRHLQQIQRYKRRLRQNMEVFYKQHGRYPSTLNPPPDLIRGSDADSESTVRLGAGGTVDDTSMNEDHFALFGTTERHAKVRQESHPKIITEVHDRPRLAHGSVEFRLGDRIGVNRSVELSSSSSGKEVRRDRLESFASSLPSHCEQCQHQLVLARDCPQCRQGSVEPSCEYCACYVCPQCNSQSLATLIDDRGTEVEGEVVQITKEQLTNIREQMASSLARLRELEEKSKDVHVLQMRINVLREEKRLLEIQVQAKDQERVEMEQLYEESQRTVAQLQSLRREDEEAFARRLVNVEESFVVRQSESPRPMMVERGVGGGDVRQLYYLQMTADDINDAYYDFDLPTEILYTLQSRWEASYKRARAEETGVRRSIGSLASPLIRHVCIGCGERQMTADAAQYVDMEEEEWRSQESSVTEGGPDFAWYQEQVASKEQRSMIQSLRRAYKFDSAEFKNIIVRLLAKSVRSQGIQVYPTVSHVGLLTDAVSKRTVGVSDDVTDVIVRPFVQHYAIGIEVRAPTTNKMTFTDRSFRYDAATNTIQSECFSVASMTDFERRVFGVYTQTEDNRVRDKGAMTEPVQVINRQWLLDAAVNTDHVAKYSIGLWTDHLTHHIDRSTGTEAKITYETAVATDPVRMYDKTINTSTEFDTGSRTMVTEEVIRSSRIAAEESQQQNDAASEGSDGSQMLCETWEEVSVVNMDGKVLQQSVTPISSHAHTHQEVSHFKKSFDTSTAGSVGMESRASYRERSGPVGGSTLIERTVTSERLLAPSSAHSERSGSSVVSEDAETSSIHSSTRKATSSEHRRSASTTRVERSRSGNEFAVTKSGAYEFGGGTVRPAGDTSSNASSSTRNSLTVESSGLKVRRSSDHSTDSRDAAGTEGAAYARSRIPTSYTKASIDVGAHGEQSKEHYSEVMTSSHHAMSESSAVHRSSSSKVDVKTTDLYAACKTLAQWMKDSTNTTSRQMNDAEANIKQAWFRLAGSRASRPEMVEPYLTAIRELGPSVLEKLVNMADDSGNTCLHYAISQSNWPMVSLLFKTSPVHVDRLNRTGYSALMLAALVDLPSLQYPNLATQIARASSNVDQHSSNGAGQTALMLAASHGRTAMVEALLTAGASPNIKDKEGSTALMCASEHGHLEVVRALLARAETDATCMDGEGSTALSIAMENNHREIALLIYARTNLAKHSATVRTTKSRRRTVQTLESATVFKYK